MKISKMKRLVYETRHDAKRRSEKMRRYAFSSALSLLGLIGFAQSPICGGVLPSVTPTFAAAAASCPASSAAYVTKYSLQSFYVPTANDPLITLNLTFHVFNNSSGSGNYQPTGPTRNDIDYIASVLHNGYERQSAPREANYSVTGFNSPAWTGLKDSRVMYVVTNIYFYNNTAMYGSTNDAAILNYISSVDPNRLNEGLPIIFNTGYTAGGAGYASSANGAPFIRTSQTPGAGNWFVYEHLRHEVGHCFGWMHTYYSSGGCCSEFQAGNTCVTADFLSDVFPLNNTMCTPGSYPCNTCTEFQQSNNVMGGGYAGTPPYNTGAGINWMSDLQMGRRIRSLHLSYNGVRQFVKEMKSENQYPWLITSNETWDFDIQMYRDVIVKTGHTLTIKCKVAMATEGKIIVEKGAKLLIDGGEITSWCKKTPLGTIDNMPLWTGIEVQGDPTQNQLINNMTGYCTNQGIVEVKNGGTLSYAHKAINTSLTTAAGTWQNNTSGGIVIADNAYFINNVFDIIFYKYQLGNVRSKITNSTFRTTGEIGRFADNTVIWPKEHVKLYQNWGLKIQGCTFDYAAGNTYAQGGRGAGIYATDSHFNVDWFCTGTCTSGNRCQFNQLTEGIWIDNFSPVFAGNIQHSDFTGNDYGLKVENSNYLSFFENNLNIPSGLTGVYIYRSKYYKVNNNTFAGQGQQGVGVLAIDSKDGAHEIYNNTFSDFNVGILCEDDNGGYHLGSNGLKMNCNVFNSGPTNTFDIAMTSNLIAPVVMAGQSPNTANSGLDLVRNVYGATDMGPQTPTKWWVDPSNTQSIRHLSTINGLDNPNTPSIQASNQVFVVPSFVSFNHTIHCPPYPQSGGNPVQPNSQKLQAMNGYIGFLRSDNLENKNLFEIQSTVSSKMNLFLNDSLADSRDSIVALLSVNQGDMTDADVQLVYTHIRNGNYGVAQEQINALSESRSDWKLLLSKMVELEQDQMGIYSLATNAANLSFINGYAVTEGKDGQASAQAMLKFVFGTDHAYPVVLPSTSSAQRLANHPEKADVIVENVGIKVFPVPTQAGVNIVNSTAGENPVKVEIKDVFGKIVYTATFSKSDNIYIPLNNYSNGMYLLTLMKNNKEIIYQGKIIKQD